MPVTPQKIHAFCNRNQWDIMVDNRAAAQAVRDGIHVIRLDDMLMVKRLAQGPRGDCRYFPITPIIPTGQMLTAQL